MAPGRGNPHTMPRPPHVTYEGGTRDPYSLSIQAQAAACPARDGMMVRLPEPFHGFHLPSYTQVPDDLFDKVMPFLTESEMKVIFYIARRTFGFKKQADAISIDQLCNGITKRTGEQLDYGTQLKRTAVMSALRSLKAANLVLSQPTTRPDGGSGPVLYALNMGSSGEADDDPRTHPVAVMGRVRADAPGGMGRVRADAPSWGRPGERSGTVQAAGGGAVQAHPQKTVIQETVIQEDPPHPPASGGRRSTRRTRAQRERGGVDKYVGGSYGVCPECGCHPHDPDCSLHEQEGATTQKQSIQMRSRDG